MCTKQNPFSSRLVSRTRKWVSMSIILALCMGTIGSDTAFISSKCSWQRNKILLLCFVCCKSYPTSQIGIFRQLAFKWNFRFFLKIHWLCMTCQLQFFLQKSELTLNTPQLRLFFCSVCQQIDFLLQRFVLHLNKFEPEGFIWCFRN